jgi:hypothetical protein
MADDTALVDTGFINALFTVLDFIYFSQHNSLWVQVLSTLWWPYTEGT